MDEAKVLEVTKKLAVAAGKEIMKVYETDFTVDYKEDHSPLTMADRNANEVIVSGLKKAFPSCAILSEEEKDDLSRREKEYCFIVDPLDGTKEFVNRNGQFTVNIALTRKGMPVTGVIYVPVTKELYYAGVNVGAFKVCETLDEIRLHVTDKCKELVVVGSRSHATKEEQELLAAHKAVIAETLSAGSSIKGCMVEEGMPDVRYRFGPTCEWDTAAMHCIAQCAGAQIGQLDGTPLTYNRENTLNTKGFYIVNRKENVWLKQ